MRQFVYVFKPKLDSDVWRRDLLFRKPRSLRYLQFFATI
jgi:hypothetical protein